MTNDLAQDAAKKLVFKGTHGPVADSADPILGRVRVCAVSQRRPNHA